MSLKLRCKFQTVGKEVQIHAANSCWEGGSLAIVCYVKVSLPPQISTVTFGNIVGIGGHLGCNKLKPVA